MNHASRNTVAAFRKHFTFSHIKYNHDNKIHVQSKKLINSRQRGHDVCRMSSHLLSFELLSPAHPEPLHHWRRAKPLSNQPNDDITQAHPHKGIPLHKQYIMYGYILATSNSPDQLKCNIRCGALTRLTLSKYFPKAFSFIISCTGICSFSSVMTQHHAFHCAQFVRGLLFISFQ